MHSVYYLILVTAAAWTLWHSPTYQYISESRNMMYLAATSWWRLSPPFLVGHRKPRGYFLHITDMHIDEGYLPGASVHSDCHRMPSGRDSLTTNTAGLLGAPGEHCDAPIELAQQTLDWIKREWRDKIDFVVWTGDNARHDWDTRRQRKRRHIYHLNERIQNMMVKAFWPTADDPRFIPLVPTFGNNDIFPHNTMGDERVDGDLLAFYERLWRPWIPLQERAIFRQGGYFAVNVGPRLRVLSLNTLYFYNKNEAVHNCQRHNTPGHAQLVWFEEQLEKARHDRVRVYVMGHVPPSPRDYRDACLDGYMRLSAEYRDVLVGHFYGHLNMDHFLMFDGREGATSRMQATPNVTLNDDDMCINRNIEEYVDWLRDMYASIDSFDSESGNVPTQPPLVVVQVSPSVLPVYFPSIRIFQYEVNEDDVASESVVSTNSDKKPHGTLLGYHQYYANITQWELDQQETGQVVPLEYQLEYHTKEAYHLDDLTPESYLQLAKNMVQDTKEGNQLWETYVRNMFVQTIQDYSIS